MLFVIYGILPYINYARVDSPQIVKHQVILSIYLGSKDLSEIKIVWSII